MKVKEDLADMIVKAVKLSTKINKSGVEYDYIYPIPRGGYAPAIILSQVTKIPIILDLNHIGDYKVLIVDDICDSGETLKVYAEQGYDTCVYYSREKTKDIPTYYGALSSDWIQFPDEPDNDIDRELLRVKEYLVSGNEGEETTKSLLQDIKNLL